MRAILIAAMLALMSTTWASATVTCMVKRTADGFVALRELPNVKSRMMFRLSPGDYVHAGMTPEGNWLYTEVWLHNNVDLTVKGKIVEGWVHKDLLVGCDG